jgi:hypothetical protein
MPEPLNPGCIFEVLARHEVDYVLIGGLAAVLHGSTAMTNDADIVPSKGEANLKRLSEALADLKARLRVESDPNGIKFDPHPALIGSMAMLSVITKGGDLNLTFTPSGLEGYEAVLANSVALELDGQVVRVASLDDIIRSKTAADRPKDHATLPILRALKEEIDRLGS